MHWYYGPTWGWGGWLVMTITMLIFWGGLIALAVVLVRRWLLPPVPREDHAERTAEQTLAERFARGEIDEEEFRRRRDALRR